MKKLISVLLIVLTALSLMTWASAADTPTVTYDGNQITYNYTDTKNFGDSFSGMVPGEERTQEINLVNSSSATTDFFMDTEVIKAFEDAAKASGAAYTVTLDIVQDGSVTNIYGGAGGSTVGGDDRGLYDLNGNLNKVFLAAKLSAGGTAQVRLTVKLDGESNTNSYQAVSGTFRFGFSVLKDDQYTGSNPPSVAYQGVKTGDESPITVLVIVLVVAVAAVIVLLMIGKKRKKSGGAN